MTDNILSFFDACQPFGYPLLACSFVLVSVILYHLLFCGEGRLLRSMLRASRLAPAAAREECLRGLCRAHPHSELAKIMLFALDTANPTDKLLEAKLLHYMDTQRTGMATISVITNIAPMLGILGTAWGLVDIFGVFGSPEAEQGIAIGISKALYTTIFGLAIAVPGMIASTCFERSLERKAALLNALFTSISSTATSR